MKKFYSALLATVLFCAGASAQTLYFKGDGQGLSWDVGTDLAVPLEDGKYTVTITDLSKFKMSTVTSAIREFEGKAVGGWDAFNSGAYTLLSPIDKANLGTPVALVPGDADITLPWEGDYTLVVNSELTEIVITTTTPEPTDITIYLRGGMNNWGNGAGELDNWAFTKTADGVYTFTCADDQIIPAGTEFKIADASWGSANWGVNGPVVCDGEPSTWIFNGSNSLMTKDWSGTVTVDLNAEGCGWRRNAMVTFSESNQGDDPVVSFDKIYLKGQGQGLSWVEGEDLIVPLEDGKFTLTIKDLVQFKMSTLSSAINVIDDEFVGGWDTYNSAAYIPISPIDKANLGSPVALVRGDANIKMPWKGDYTLVINSNLTEIVITTTTPEPTDITLYLRGGMNNWGWGTGEGDLDNWAFTETADGVYTFTCAEGQIIPAGTELKIADYDWGANWGAGRAVECNGEASTWFLNGDNSLITKDWSGTVTLDLNAEGCGWGKNAMVTFSDSNQGDDPVVSFDKLYLKGDGQGLSWVEGDDLIVPLEDGKFTVTIKNLMKFKMSTVSSSIVVREDEYVGGWDAFNSAAYNTISPVDKANLGSPIALIPGDYDITMPWKGDYTLVVNSNLTEIVITTTTPEPTDITLYLRGGMNNWGWGTGEGDLDNWAFTETADGVYTFTCAEGQIIPAGTELKIGDYEWNSANWGLGGTVECDGNAVEWFFIGDHSLINEDWSGTVTVDLNAEGCGWGKNAMVTFSAPRVTSAVEEVSVDTEAKEYFNLQGIRVENPENGLSIVRHVAKTSKVLVK